MSFDRNKAFGCVDDFLVFLENLGIKSASLDCIIDIHVESFLTRCEHLWKGNSDEQT